MWAVGFGDEFDEEFKALSEPVQDELLASALLLATFGPRLGRPHADTLSHSERKAILLVAGDKSGVNEKRFYRTLIAKADRRYRGHLDGLVAARKETG